MALNDKMIGPINSDQQFISDKLEPVNVAV